jgi:hypothetical protein
MAFPSLYLNVSNACRYTSLKIKDEHKFGIDFLMPPKSSQIIPNQQSQAPWSHNLNLPRTRQVDG